MNSDVLLYCIRIPEVISFHFGLISLWLGSTHFLFNEVGISLGGCVYLTTEDACSIGMGLTILRQSDILVIERFPDWSRSTGPD